jgi:hypothetical protein
VRHVGNSVAVDFSGNASFVVTNKEWKCAVYEFSAQVRAFFFAVPRDASDQTDAEWYPRFVEEWDRRHEAAA